MGGNYLWPFLVLTRRRVYVTQQGALWLLTQLALDDVTSHQSTDGQHYWMVHIMKQSKTDQRRQGVTLYILTHTIQSTQPAQWNLTLLFNGERKSTKWRLNRPKDSEWLWTKGKGAFWINISSDHEFLFLAFSWALYSNIYDKIRTIRARITCNNARNIDLRYLKGY